MPCSRDEETNQTVIEGMGELHLEIIVDRLKREFKVECDVGAPQVNYREGISRNSEVRYVHKKQSGGSGQFADVAIKFEPGEPGTGFEFRSEIKGGVVPKEYIPGVLKVGRRARGHVACVCRATQACEPSPPPSSPSPPPSPALPGPGGDDEQRLAGRLPRGGRQGHAGGWLVPRC